MGVLPVSTSCLVISGGGNCGVLTSCYCGEIDL